MPPSAASCFPSFLCIAKLWMMTLLCVYYSLLNVITEDLISKEILSTEKERRWHPIQRPPERALTSKVPPAWRFPFTDLKNRLLRNQPRWSWWLSTLAAKWHAGGGGGLARQSLSFPEAFLSSDMEIYAVYLLPEMKFQIVCILNITV